MITKRVEYMLLALLDLARSKGEGYVLSRDVASRQDIPAKYMPQIMAILTKKGWVDSARGAGGGVRLAVDPKSLSVQDVIEASGDPLLIKECALGVGKCPKQDTCPLHGIWQRAQDSIDRTMRGTTIADLLS
ncbi:MAG: RrF2 family transcriptional regulator [Bacillota bacterium]